MRLKDKVAIVTGGATGIGEAIVKKFSSEGATIVIVGLQDDPVEEVVNEVKQEYNTPVIGLIKNVARKDEAQEVIEETVSAFGRVDILISNASILPQYIELDKNDDDGFEDILDANIRSTYYMVKAALPELRKTRGNIVASGSIAGINGLPESNPYAGSKAFIHAFIKGVAIEQGKYGIRANVVAPGPIDTEMTRKEVGGMNEEAEKTIVTSTVFGRRGTTEEAANVYCFLASDEASYVTASVYNVDNGISMAIGPVGEKAEESLKEYPEGKLNIRHAVVREESYGIK